MVKEKQKEMKGMPERTPLGKKAIEFLAQKDEIDDEQKKLEKIKEGLIVLFKTEKKSAINVNGRVVTYSHTDKDTIGVRKE